MPKAHCASRSNSRSASGHYPIISFVPPRSASSLRRNQACKQCRKRKSKCDAGRPCKACLRAHAVVVANLVKRGLPYDSIQPECSYDGESGSQYSSPTELTPSPVQPSDESPTLQSHVPKQLDANSQQIDDHSPFFPPLSLIDWPIVYPVAGCAQDTAACADALSYTHPDYLVSLQPEPHSYSPPSYQHLLELPQHYICDPTQLGDPSAEWVYHNPQVTPSSQYYDADALQLMWNTRL